MNCEIMKCKDPLYISFLQCLPGQNRVWVKFEHFWPKNDSEKWYRKNIFEIPTCHFLLDEFIS